jgi:hypothetical protein
VHPGRLRKDLAAEAREVISEAYHS